MTELMRDSLVLARNLGMDVFNALNLMQNQEFLQVRPPTLAGYWPLAELRMHDAPPPPLGGSVITYLHINNFAFGCDFEILFFPEPSEVW